MGFLLISDSFFYGQRSKCADLLNSYEQLQYNTKTEQEQSCN
jgi:hypothetical protein